MPGIQCRLVRVRRDAEVPFWETEDGTRVQPGDLFYAPQMLEEYYRRWLSAAYWALPETRRPPLIVIVPGGHWHCLDQQQCSDGKFHEPG